MHTARISMANDLQRYPNNPPATILDSPTISPMRQSDALSESAEQESRRHTRIQQECLPRSKHIQAVQDVDPKLASKSYALGIPSSVLVSLGSYPRRETPLPTAAPRQSSPPHEDRLYSTHRMASTWRPSDPAIAECGGSLWSTSDFPMGTPESIHPLV